MPCGMWRTIFTKSFPTSLWQTWLQVILSLKNILNFLILRTAIYVPVVYLLQFYTVLWWFQCGCGSKTEFGSRVLMSKNFNKIAAEKIFLYQIVIYLSKGLHERHPSYVQEKLSALKREHPALQT
jgi:hypothetical protein